MKLQLLIVTMNQKDHSLLERMNVQTTAIVGNQCDKNSIEEFDYNGNHIKYLNFAERGVGLNRNNGLMRADADIVLFADDDMVYVDGYEKGVLDAFSLHPDADAIIFSVKITKNGSLQINLQNKNERAHLYNSLKYGTYLIAAKRQSLLKSNISFSQLFGGGCMYGSGEDSLFIMEMFKSGLKVYKSGFCLGENKKDSSTWFNGFNEKYIFDKGAWFKCACQKWPLFRLFKYYWVWRYSQQSQYSYLKTLKIFNKGKKSFECLIPFIGDKT